MRDRHSRGMNVLTVVTIVFDRNNKPVWRQLGLNGINNLKNEPGSVLKASAILVTRKSDSLSFYDTSEERAEGCDENRKPLTSSDRWLVKGERNWFKMYPWAPWS